MNLLETGEESSDSFFVNFNQDSTSLAVGTRNGFKIISLAQLEDLDIIHENNADDVRIVERLFSSSLVAIVMISAPRKLKVCHFKKGTEICNYSYSNTILAVKLNRARLVVCLEESLYIHNIRDMKVLHRIRDTPPNPYGLCVLSVSNTNCYLAYPGSSSIGEVQVFDAYNLQANSMIPAHDNPLAAMAFDSTGTKLATASGKGTVIRVFNVADGCKLYEFRRSVKRNASIYSLSFSENSAFLSASSNTETVHIFKLDDCRDVRQPDEPQTWLGYFGKAFMQSATYLPCQVAEMFNHGRSFATVHLPFSGMRNICSLAMIEKQMRLVIVASDGSLYIYNVDCTEGGDCTLAKRHSLNASDEEDVAGQIDEGFIGDNVPNAQEFPNGRRPQTGGASYAAVVRGNEANTAQEQSKLDTDLPQPNAVKVGELKIDDEYEFPPMAHNNEA